MTQQTAHPLKFLHVFIVILLLFTSRGCGLDSLPDGLPSDIDQITECSRCHGNGDNAAPPLSTTGSSQIKDIGVGAHQAHMRDGLIRAAIDCSSCHIVPPTAIAPGHRNGLPAEIVWSDFARRGGLKPQWDRTSEKCSATYCHGASLSGGAIADQIWTLVDGSQVLCGSCHGNPPPPPHATSATCWSCHPQTVTSAGTIDIAGGFHIDGEIQTSQPSECNACHGNETNAAPPVSTTGATGTDDITVGAHQSHLRRGNIRAALPCESCHIVPGSVDAPGHIDTPPAEITWSDLAMANGTNPRWDRSSARCSATWCHGSSLGGGSVTDPLWTLVNGTQAACGTCHGVPPPFPHSTSASCSTCHPGTVNSDGSVNIDGGLHIDGAIQAEGTTHPSGWDDPTQHGYAFYYDPQGCKDCHGQNYDGGTSGVSCDSCHSGGAAWRTNCLFCHGGRNNQTGAPPDGARGESTRSYPGVGAHSVHVEARSSHIAYDCSICHRKPSSFQSSGHIDGNFPAEVIFSGIAGSSAGYSTGSATCSALYCHGNGRSTSGTLYWTSTSALTCSSCHGYYSDSSRLSGEHHKHIDDENLRCNSCHNSVVNSSDSIINAGLHINGAKNVSMAAGSFNTSSKDCSNTGCHETENWYDD